MTPEYLYHLADLADPAKLWKLDGFRQMDLEPFLRQQLDTGVALRRYAAHRAKLLVALEAGKSVLITPLSSNGAAVHQVETPPMHKKLRKQHNEI